MIQPILITLYPNEYSQGLSYYPFSVNLGKCVRIFNILNDISNRACVPNKNRRFKLKCFEYDNRNK